MRADGRMRTVQESIDTLANQPRVPESRVLPTQGNEELRMHVDETAARILGQQSAQLGEFGRHMGGFANELVRNLREHNGHLSGMLRHLTQASQGNPAAAIAQGNPPPPPPPPAAPAIAASGPNPPPPPAAPAVPASGPNPPPPPPAPSKFRFGSHGGADGDDPSRPRARARVDLRAAKRQDRSLENMAVSQSAQTIGREAALEVRRQAQLANQEQAASAMDTSGPPPAPPPLPAPRAPPAPPAPSSATALVPTHVCLQNCAQRLTGRAPRSGRKEGQGGAGKSPSGRGD